MSEKAKQTLSKILPLLEKLSITDAIEVWHEVGDKIHQRIEANEKELQEQREKLKSKS
jgi:hypothetical protein